MLVVVRGIRQEEQNFLVELEHFGIIVHGQLSVVRQGVADIPVGGDTVEEQPNVEIQFRVADRAGSNYTKSLQLQLHHHNVILNYNYNYTMFISITITITAPFLHKLHFYLWNCGLIGFGCFPCLACCLVPTQPRNALRLHNIATSGSICVGQLN